MKKAILILKATALILLMGYAEGVEYDPFKVTFYTKKIKGKTFEEVISEIEEKLNEVNLPVIGGWEIKSMDTHEEIIYEDQIDSIVRYKTILACDIKDRDELIRRTPVLANLIPCSINIYETVNGEVYVSILNEKLFLVRYKKYMLTSDIKRVKAVYMRIRCVIREVAL